MLMHKSADSKASDFVEASLSLSVVVKNKMGIHARPAAMIVRIANKYSDVEVWVAKAEERVNAKSIMGLMMLAAAKESKILITAEGDRAQLLLDEMKALFDRKFDED